MFDPLGGPPFPGLGDPRIRVGNRLMYPDYHGGLHSTEREMWESNASIEDREGREACQRRLDLPDRR